MSQQLIPREIFQSIFHRHWYNEGSSRHFQARRLVRTATVSRWWHSAVLLSVDSLLLTRQIGDAQLLALPNLTEIHVSSQTNFEVTAKGLSSLQKLKYLHKPDLWNVNNNVLVRLPALQELRLDEQELGSGNPWLLVELTGIRTLTLYESHYSTLRQLPRLTRLTSLCVSGSAIVHDAQLWPLVNLTFLDVASAPNLTGDCLRTLSALRHLVVLDTKGVDAGFSHVANTLTHLRFNSGSAVRGGHLSRLTALETLDAGYSALQRFGHALPFLYRLRRLDHQGMIFTGEKLASLYEIK